MPSFQNAFARVTHSVQRNRGPTNPSQSAGPQRSFNLHEDTTAGAELLPPGWEERHTPGGTAYYVDHNTGRATRVRPSTERATESRPLPPGWEEWHTPEGRAYYVDHNTKNKTWTMPTSRVLQRLYSFDTSSPDFLHHLYHLIQHDEEQQYLTSLQGSELVQAVDFLDKVHLIPSAFYQFTKQTPQALGAIPTTDGVARECLNNLQTICGHHAILPSPYIASGQIDRVGDDPVALGVVADVWEGTYCSKKVLIKCLRIRTENYQTHKKVRIQCGTSSSHLLKNTAVILQRGGHLEKVKTPEHRPFPRCYNRSFANNLGVDAERNSDEVRREKSRRESDRPGESFPAIALDR